MVNGRFISPWIWANNLKIFGVKILPGLFIILAVFILVILSRNKNQDSAVRYIQQDIILPHLNNGDIICRLGDRIWSQFFKEISSSDKRFSHLGVIRINDDVVSVIHAEGMAEDEKNFVKEVPLEDFLKISQRIGIYRIKDYDGNALSDIALDYLGRPFDWQFDMNDEKEIYCTELLYLILKRIDPEMELKSIWLNEIGRNIIPLEACSQSDYFFEVGYWNK